MCDQCDILQFKIDHNDRLMAAISDATLFAFLEKLNADLVIRMAAMRALCAGTRVP
jgi:hypothetical protein